MPEQYRTRVGVIGGGNWGKNLIRNYANLPPTLAAICEVSPDLRAGYSEAYPDAVLFDDLEAMLAGADLDAIVIATPAVTHGGIVARALEAGLNVYVEKPLCLDVGEARQLQRQAQEAGRVLMVGHLLLYHPAFRALQAAVSEGRIGSLRYIYSNRLNLGRIRREENALWSFAPHDISMILALSGGLPARASCNGGTYLSSQVADTTMSYLHWDNGLKAHIFVSWLHPYKDQRLVVIGEHGMIVFDDVAKGPDKLLLYPHRVGWEGDVPLVDKAEAIPIPYGDEEPLAEECRSFLNACENGAAVPSDAAEGTRVLQVLDACQRSLTSGEPVDLHAEPGE